MSEFARNFVRILAERKISFSEFARLTGTVNSFISHVTRDERRPPLDRLDLWLDALGLNGPERKRVQLLAYLAHCPAEIEAQFLAQEQTIDTLTRRVDTLESRRAAEPVPNYSAEQPTLPTVRPGNRVPKP